MEQGGKSFIDFVAYDAAGCASPNAGYHYRVFSPLTPGGTKQGTAAFMVFANAGAPACPARAECRMPAALCESLSPHALVCQQTSCCRPYQVRCRQRHRTDTHQEHSTAQPLSSAGQGS